MVSFNYQGHGASYFQLHFLNFFQFHTTNVIGSFSLVKELVTIFEGNRRSGL